MDYHHVSAVIDALVSLHSLWHQSEEVAIESSKV